MSPTRSLPYSLVGALCLLASVCSPSVGRGADAVEDPHESPAPSQNRGGRPKRGLSPTALIEKARATVAAQISAKIKIEPPLAPDEIGGWEVADLNGDGTPEIVMSWGQGSVHGGVVLVAGDGKNYKILNGFDLKEPVLKVELQGLAGDGTKHLLVRTGVDAQTGGSTRRDLILDWNENKLEKIWEHRDRDQIIGNLDLTQPREATLSKVTVQEGMAGRPGTLTVSLTRFRAERGQGEEQTKELASEILRFRYDPVSRRLKQLPSPPPQAPAPEASPAPSEGSGETGEDQR